MTKNSVKSIIKLTLTCRIKIVLIVEPELNLKKRSDFLTIVASFYVLATLKNFFKNSPRLCDFGRAEKSNFLKKFIFI